MKKRGKARAAVGVTVKSGWATAVLIGGSASWPRLLDSRRVDLSDPAIPESRQPYHAGFATPRSSGRHLSGLIASVRRFGGHSVTGLIRGYQNVGHDIRGVGVVVGSLIDPQHIANDHIRIHALEGRLFRRVVEHAAARASLPCFIWRERDLYPFAAKTFRRSEEALRDTLTRLGRELPGPWRAEHKTAALAAWLVLTPRARATRTIRDRRSAA